MILLLVAGEFKVAGRPPSGGEETDANLVDKLLGDIRSGFTNKLGDNPDFSVTKVTKVKLESDPSGNVQSPGDGRSTPSTPSTPDGLPPGDFNRQGSFRKRGSLVTNRLRAIEENKHEGVPSEEKSEEDLKKVRRSAEINESDGLFEYLMQAGDEADKALFERQGSLRRRRRRNNNNNSYDPLAERERASSPALSEEAASPRDSLTKPIEKRWRSNMDKGDVDKALAHHYLERRGSRSPVPISPGAPSPLVSGEGRVRSFASDPGDPDKTRWSTSSTDTQPESLDDEAARERARRRQERKKRSTLDHLDVRAALHKPFDSEPSTPRSEGLISDQTASERWAEAAGRRGVVKSESDSCVVRTMQSMEPSPEEKPPPGPSAHSDTADKVKPRHILKNHGNLDAMELASALKTIEEQEKLQQRMAEGSGNSSLVSTPEKKSRDRLAQRYQNNLEPSAVSAAIQQVEGGINVIPAESEQFRIKSSTLPRAKGDKRWQSSIERTDVDNVIRSIEKTGREIQLIASQQDLNSLEDNAPNFSSPSRGKGEKNNSLNAINDDSRNDGGSSSRRWRSHVEVSDVHEALRRGEGSDNGPVPIPPPRTTSRSRRSGEQVLASAPSDEQLSRKQSQDNETEQSNSLRARLDKDCKSRESLTEKAWLKHSTGRWRSNIEKADVDEAFQQMNISKYGDGSSSENTSPSRRPVSTYDNVSSENKTALPELPSTKRWARYYDADSNNTQSLNRRRSAILDSNEHDASDDPHSPSLHKPEDAGYYSLDRGRLQRSQSLRISHLRKPQEGTDASELFPSKWRRNAETREIDENVQQFQTRVPETERNRRKERFKSLSKLYTDEGDDRLWQPSPSPIPQRIEEESDKSNANMEDQCMNMINKMDHGSPRGLRLPDDSLLPKSDTDSVASNKDEGFETESMSDPNASQRTSMSSTLESELSGTPTLGRKDYSKQKSEVIEEPEENRNYFARSIDSLVQRQELAACERSMDDINDPLYNDGKVPATDENRSEAWVQQNSDSDGNGKTVTNTPEDENTDEPWTIETVTVERKFSDMSQEEQQALLSSMEPDRPPTPPERTTSIKSQSPALHRRQTNNGTQSSRLSMSHSTRTDSPRKDPSHTKSSSSTPVRPPRPGSSSTNKTGKGSVAAAVTARLTRPKRPSATPTTNMLTRAPSNSSVASEASTASTSSSSRRSTPSKSRAPARLSVSTGRDRTSSPGNRSSMISDNQSSHSSNPFVRGSATRATMPASVLRSNKRVAAEHREKEAPSPPARSSSIRVSERLHLGRTNSTRSQDSESNSSYSGRSARVAPESSKPPAPSLSRPRKSMSISTNQTSVPGKNDKVANYITKLNTTKGRVDVEEGGTAKVRPRHLSFNAPSSLGSSGPSSGSSSPGSEGGKKDKSPSFLKKIIDKTPYRKSTLNKGELGSSPGLDRKRITVIKSTTKSSKC